MKKTLLMLVAFMATMTAFAEDEGWSKSFTPVTSASNLKGLCTAVTADGSVYASSTYDQAFQFAGKAVTDPEGLLSSCVVKYDKDGNELWAVSLLGQCTINAMTCDADGTLYVAGNYTDASLTLSGTSGSKILAGDASKASAFVAKVSTDGVFTEAISFVPTATIPEGYENWCELGIYPNKIVIDANKVLVSCMFKGDVAELGWLGSYVDAYMMAYMDNRSGGIFMLDKANLSNPSSVATIQHTGLIVNQMMDEIQDYPDAIDFIVYEGVPYLAFIGWGNLTLTTPAGSQAFNFEMAGGGNNEHAFVMANAAAPSMPKVFHADPNSYGGAVYDLVDAAIAGENCILGGTFYGNFPLKPEITTDANTSFVASIKMADCSVNWTTPNTVASEATCMIVTGEEIKASSYAATYTLKTATGEVKADKTINYGFADADVYNDEFVSTIRANGTSVVVFSPKMSPSGIEAIKAAAVNGEAKIYNLNGQRVAAPQKGLYIVNGKKAVIK